MDCQPRVTGQHSEQRVYSGPGSRCILSEILDVRGAERVFVVSTRSLEAHQDAILALIGDRHAGSYARCEQHAPVRTIEEAVRLASGADLLVSFGGGSVVDSTKAIARQIGRPPHVAIPTTLSAAEMTHLWGTYDEVARQRQGDPILSDLPEVVIHDAELSVHTPEGLWLGAGVRAIDHALETIWAQSPHPISETLALEALTRLDANLLASRDPKAIESRDQCYLAAAMSIQGLLDAGLRLSHSIGHQIGAYWNVVHGVTSCICLPHVMRFLAPRTEIAQSKIARAFGVESPAQAADHLEGLIASVGLPTRLRDVGADHNELDAMTDSLRQELVHFKSVEADSPGLRELVEAMW